MVAELADGAASRARRMRALCALWRDRRGRRGGDRGDARRGRGGLDRQALQTAMPAGAARNALDCAFWDLEAKTRRPAGPRARRACRRRGRSPPPTRSRSGRRRRWREAAAQGGGAQAPEGEARRRGRSGAHRARCARPRRNAELIVDANEAWRADNLADNLAACAAAGVTLVEQPLPAGDDAALARDRAADPGLRRRERARPRLARRRSSASTTRSTSSSTRPAA